jgi:tellurite methyltransferase
MFFDRSTLFKVLSDLQAHVRPGGLAVVNVLIEGTTYMEMFDASGFYLPGRSELQQRFSTWTIEHLAYSDFDAPQETIKRFCTLVARRPIATAEKLY